MPNCFTLTRKGETAPISLSKLDEELCTYFGVKVDPVRYYCEWYNIIGFKLAMGKNWQEIRERFVESMNKDPNDNAAIYKQLLAIVDYLEENYVSDCFVQIGKS